MSKPVILVNYGLGSSYNDFVEMNASLYAETNTKLKDSILRHERNHRNGRYSKHDFMNDFQAKNSNFFESLKFCGKHPEAWIGFFPLMYSYYAKDWSWNTSALVPFVYFGLIFSLFFKILFSISFFMAFLGYSVMFTTLNLLLLLITHILVKKSKITQYAQIN